MERELAPHRVVGDDRLPQGSETRTGDGAFWRRVSLGESVVLLPCHLLVNWHEQKKQDTHDHRRTLTAFESPSTQLLHYEWLSKTPFPFHSVFSILWFCTTYTDEALEIKHRVRLSTRESLHCVYIPSDLLPIIFSEFRNKTKINCSQKMPRIAVLMSKQFWIYAWHKKTFASLRGILTISLN